MKGHISKEFTVWCGVRLARLHQEPVPEWFDAYWCEDHFQFSDPRPQISPTHYAQRVGYRRISQFGWICASCFSRRTSYYSSSKHVIEEKS